MSKRLTDIGGGALPRVGGFETEYGLNCVTTHANGPYEAAHYLTGLVIEIGDQYKENGSRHYEDVGFHPEACTAEDTWFLGSAYRLLAEHVALARAYQRAFEIRSPGQRISYAALVANTCDTTGHSWGSHANLNAARGLLEEDYVDVLTIHNLSKIVMFGCGHVSQAKNGTGALFELSEKAGHIFEEAGTDTTIHRSLVNLRDEPLADSRRWRRIHDTSGETIFSPHLNALRLATTSIILRACELEIDFSDLLPDDMSGAYAMKEISNDPTLTTTIKLANGKELTGVEIQLALAERSIAAGMGANYLTEQEIEWGGYWIQLLDDLRNDPDSCADRLDWLVKYRAIEEALDGSSDSSSDFYVASKADISYHYIWPFEGRGMKALRQGEFRDSPPAEVLETGLIAPETTRAKLRGAAIKRMREIGRKYQCSWEKFNPQGHERGFTLDNPYQTENWNLEQFLESAA